MITLTTEQAQQIEEALEDIVRVFEFETGTPVEALATIREARAEQELYEPEGRCKECLAYNGHLDYCSKSAPVKRPQNCGTGYCSCIECPYEPVKQEPVEWHVENVYERGDKYFAWIGDGYVQIFTAPVDAKAIRSEALEEAAKVCEAQDLFVGSGICAAAIRSME